jgi:CheY-like chemotaxis protein
VRIRDALGCLLMGAKILIVDDEPSVRECIELVLRERGYLFETAEDAEEALAICGTKRFDLVLSDMKMPGMDGQQLLKHLRAIDPGQKVILVTAFAPADVSLFDAVVTKPFSFEELRNRVSAALSRDRP